MADQSVRVTNLPDSGSVERVAYDLYYYLRPSQKEGQSEAARKAEVLGLYSECLRVVKGYDPPSA